MSLALAGVGAASFVLGGLYCAHLQQGARLDATARIVDTGVDSDGYWFARVEFTNAGTLPWYVVQPHHLTVLGDPGFSLEIGSTLPYGHIPNHFEVVVEAVHAGIVPAQVAGVGLQLSVISAEPWYLGERKIGIWSYDLHL